jgi:hypothetical protein
LAGGFLLFLGWQFYLHAHHVSAPADFARLNAGTQWQHVDRLVPVLLELARNLADWRAWTCRLIEKPQQPSAGRRGLRLTDATATRCKEKRY